MSVGGFVFYRSFLDTAEELGKIDKDLEYQYLRAIVKYGIDGEEIEVDNPIVKAMLKPMYCSVDAAVKRYEESSKNGRKGGRPKKIDDDEVRRLHNLGFSNKEIAEELNCSESSVRKILSNSVLMEE